MLFVALIALCLVIPHVHGRHALAVLAAFVVIMVELLRDLKGSV